MKIDTKTIQLIVIASLGLFITTILTSQSSGIRLSLAVGLGTILIIIIYGFSIIYQELKKSSVPDSPHEISKKVVNDLVPLLSEHFPQANMADINQQLLDSITAQFEQNRAFIESSTGLGAENAYKYSTSKYGMGYQLLDVKCFISENGSAKIERIVSVEAFSEIEKLDTYMLVPEDDIEQNFGLEYVESLTTGRNVQMESPEDVRSKNKTSRLLTIAPRLQHGDEFVYRLAEKISPLTFAINLTSKEISERETAYDYFAWNINRPTRKLTITVEFPRDYSPTIYDREVRFASASGLPAEQRQFEEQKILQKITFSTQGRISRLNLEVDYPMTGLMYLISWDPKSIKWTG